MATLTLNTSITSYHKDDFYSTTDEYWIKINNLTGNYFSDSDCPGGNPMDFYVRIVDTTIWKYVGGCSDFNYYYAPCWQSCGWNYINARYYNFNDANDPDNYKYIDKIAVTYLGLRNESFVNRCFINITAVDNNNVPLYGVTVLDSNIPTTDDSNFLAFTTENGGNPVCTPTCRDPLTTSIGAELKACNTEVSLMQTQKQNDCILIETEGIPTKLTFTINTPGVYTGTLNYQYWNGVDWIYFQEVIDETNGFRNSGIRNVTLPIVSDWKRRTWGYAPGLVYICRAIFDSQPLVTTVPKASCLRWSGSYPTTTNLSGIFQFTTFTSGGKTITIPGILPGYICTSGNGQLTIPEATESKDINLTLIKTDLTCNLTCPTTVYKNQTKNILVTSTVSFGSVSNTLTISSPKTTTETFNPSAGIDVPISYTFNEESIYKIQLRSEDVGGNVVGKLCYANVTSPIPGECDKLTDQFSCELNNCFWTGDKCVSTDPHIELSSIYQSIIDKTVCISSYCINTLDLNNDGLIDLTDKDLSLSLSYDKTISKILSYQICKELNPCESELKLNTSILVGGITLGLVYIYTKTKK